MSQTISPTMLATITGTATPWRYFDADDCGKRYRFSKRHWLRLVDAGKAPQPTRFGRLVRWSERTLDEWDAAGNPAVRHVSAKGGQR